MRYEGDIYRPPGEWKSYLLQATVAAPTTPAPSAACTGPKFRVRPVADILEDIQRYILDTAARINEMRRRHAPGVAPGAVTGEGKYFFTSRRKVAIIYLLGRPIVRAAPPQLDIHPHRCSDAAAEKGSPVQIRRSLTSTVSADEGVITHWPGRLRRDARGGSVSQETCRAERLCCS